MSNGSIPPRTTRSGLRPGGPDRHPAEKKKQKRENKPYTRPSGSNTTPPGTSIQERGLSTVSSNQTPSLTEKNGGALKQILQALIELWALIFNSQRAASQSENTVNNQQAASQSENTVNNQQAASQSENTVNNQQAASQSENTVNSQASAVSSDAIPGLYNWGSTCFINAYLNHMVYSLSNQDITKLEHLENLGKTEKKMRDTIADLWVGFNEPYPQEEITQLQYDFLCACTRLGKERRENNNTEIPDFFAKAFPHKEEYILASGQAVFSDIRQEDADELQVAMHDLLFNNLPSRQPLIFETYKTGEVLDVEVTALVKSSPIQTGLNLPVSKQSDLDKYTMQACIESYYTSSTATEMLVWSKEQLEMCGFPKGIMDEGEVENVLSKKTELLAASENTRQITVKFNSWERVNDVSEKLPVDRIIEAYENGGDLLDITLKDADTQKYNRMQFKPKSILCHMGRSPNSGHYVTITFQDDGRIMMHNDSRVYELDKNNTVAEHMRKENITPYIIDYHRVNISASERAG